MKQQRRSRAIAQTPGEIDTFLSEQRICRVATTGPDGPHVAPLWFVWHDQSLWLYSLTRSQRWANLQRDPRVSVVVDDGEIYRELRGVELRGTVEPVGEAPRVGTPDPELAGPEQAFADKYSDGVFTHDGRHAWLRLVPAKTTSWDFRKIPAR
jgi:hypothetical protein